MRISRSCAISLLLTVAACGGSGLLLAADAPTNVLTTAAEVRSLTAAEARRHYPVTLSGVVTFYGVFSQFIQDDTAGIYLARTNMPPLSAGQLVEVDGYTDPGEYAPIVVPRHVRIVGNAPLPEAQPVTFEQMASGKEDSQFVEVTGIVRSVVFEAPSRSHIIELATGGGRVTVYARDLSKLSAQDLVDSTARIRGVCCSQFNRQRQLFALRVMVPTEDGVTIENPAASDPFAAPERKISSLFQFAPEGEYGHRVKVTGTVTFFEPGAWFYVQDGNYGLFAQTMSTNPLAVGDRVEILGFATPGQYTPALQDAVYRKIGEGALPTAAKINRDDALRGYYDCRLVHLEGKLLNHAQVGLEHSLALESDGFVFHAYQQTDDGSGYANLQLDSEVAVTGICMVEPGQWQAGETWRAKSFRILLRSPADVVVLRAPPYWTLEKMLWIAGALGFAVIGAFAWIAALRRRVHEQTQTIRQQLEVEATLKERYVNLFENANDIVFTHDLAGRFTSINATGEHIFQRARQEILRLNLMDLLPEDQRTIARQWLEQIPRQAEPPTIELDFLNAAGQRIRLEISTRIIDTGAEKTEAESIGRDITERKRLEKEILEVSNREQRRIGHDLHDGVCQQLVATAYLTDILADKLEEKKNPEATEAEHIGKLINQSIQQTRGIARGLFPVKLEEAGLPSALEELTASTSALFHIDCHCSCDLRQTELANDVALHLYYIAQEGVLNAARHGKASHVSVTLARNNGSLTLTVEDDGVGLKPSAPGQTAGMGIRIMRYRASVLGGTLALKNRPGQGTLVQCELHLSAKDQKAAHD